MQNIVSTSFQKKIDFNGSNPQYKQIVKTTKHWYRMNIFSIICITCSILAVHTLGFKVWITFKTTTFTRISAQEEHCNQGKTLAKFLPNSKSNTSGWTKLLTNDTNCCKPLFTSLVYLYYSGRKLVKVHESKSRHFLTFWPLIFI